jgi:hypothetical protein
MVKVIYKNNKYRGKMKVRLKIFRRFQLFTISSLRLSLNALGNIANTRGQKIPVYKRNPSLGRELESAETR